jgi:hypothetical protein
MSLLFGNPFDDFHRNDLFKTIERMVFNTPVTFELGDFFQGPKNRDEARLTINLQVHGKTTEEQNMKLAEQLRKVADEIEAQAVEEEAKEEGPPPEPKVSWNIKRA